MNVYITDELKLFYLQKQTGWTSSSSLRVKHLVQLGRGLQKFTSRDPDQRSNQSCLLNSFIYLLLPLSFFGLPRDIYCLAS